MEQLIDVHAHFVTDEYVAAARAGGHEHPDGMPGFPAWSLDEQISSMGRRGIARALLSISSPGVNFGDDAAAADLARLVNDQAAGFMAQHPDRLGFLASLPLPDVDAAVVEATRAIDRLGARGVIVESNAHGQYLGAPELEPLWAELARRDAVVFLHPTSPPAWQQTALGRPRPMLEFMFDSTRTIVDLVFAGVLQRHRGLRVVVPHSGATLPILNDRIAMFQQGFLPDDDSMPWAEAMRALWFDTAGTPFPTCVPVLEHIAGTEHLLYGSDSCWTPAPVVDAQIASIDAAPAPRDAASWRELTSRNAERLLAH